LGDLFQDTPRQSFSSCRKGFGFYDLHDDGAATHDKAQDGPKAGKTRRANEDGHRAADDTAPRGSKRRRGCLRRWREAAQSEDLRHRRRTRAPCAAEAEHQGADRGEGMPVEGAEIDCAACPAAQNTSSQGGAGEQRGPARPGRQVLAVLRGHADHIQASPRRRRKNGKPRNHTWQCLHFGCHARGRRYLEGGVRASPRQGWALELAGRPCHDS
jgi:hypothetical protein